MNKIFFYVLGLLILQLSFFGCFNPKNELNTNKADESQVYDETLSENITSNIDTTTSNNSTSKINENDPNSFTPLQEEEVLLCDYVSNNNVSIKIKNNTNNNNELKSYNVNYIAQSEDEKKVLLQTRKKGKINLLLIDGPQGKIKTIYMHGYPLAIETTSNFELIMIFNESKEVIIYNTELDEIIFQETIQVEEIYEPVPFYSEFENKFIIYLNDDEYDYGEYNYSFSDDKNTITQNNFEMYEQSKIKRDDSKKLIFPKLEDFEKLNYNLIEDKLTVIIEDREKLTTRELFSINLVHEVKLSKDNNRLFFIKEASGISYIHIVDGIKGNVISLIPCNGLYQIDDKGNFLLLQNSENTVMLFDPIFRDIIMSYKIELPTSNSKIMDIKYDVKDSFIVDIGDGSEILSTKEIMIK